ncbi:uncharacterized protein B0I36DRAFT_338886 [Microdochium trichocladiopsis]|uniref:Uncharacterized protein n=1 Tax=Microdochium trichocladiopsis TaxID=1682393 RepID=A0A9P9BLY5_9PEZI|nr:uncharacterized protein B0I36DRAFT_338886 [Microdochium trichocladiopsis]KAH7014552.1 hypothetical protein B0I36DRAFT_338886 [Microdochium trichocladiopsis]
MTSFLSTMLRKPSFSINTKDTSSKSSLQNAAGPLTPSTVPLTKTMSATSTASTSSPTGLERTTTAASTTAAIAAASATPRKPRKPEITTQRFMPLDFNIYSAPSAAHRTISSFASPLTPKSSTPLVKTGGANTNSSGNTLAAPANTTTASGSSKTKPLEPTHYLGPHRKDRLFGITDKHNSLRARPGPFLVLHDGLQSTDAALGVVTNTYSVGAEEEKARKEREAAKEKKKVDKAKQKEEDVLNKTKSREDRAQLKADEAQRKKAEKEDKERRREQQRLTMIQTSGFWDAYTISVMAYGEDVSGLFVTENLRALQVGTRLEPRTVLRFAMDATAAFAPDCAVLRRLQKKQSKSGDGAGVVPSSSTLTLPRQEFEWYEAFTPVPGPGFEPQSEGWRLVARGRDDSRGEPLAMCVPNSRSRNKALHFEFVGEGKVAGKYGVSWELMAIMSGMVLCHRLVEIGGSSG